MIGRAKVAAACVIGLAVCAPTVHAQDDAFKAGLQARGGKKWGEVVEHMRRAIKDDPQESTRKVELGWRRGSMEYLPYYFLGEALFNIGDCPAAVAAWSTSDQKGAVLARPEFVKILQNGYKECETKKGVLPPSKFDPPLAATERLITRVTKLAEKVSADGKEHNDLWDSEMTQQYNDATSELQNARRRLNAATQTRAQSDFNEADAAANRAENILKGVSSSLDAKIATRASVQKQVNEVEQSLEAATGLDRVIQSKRALLTPALTSERRGANQTLDKARVQLDLGRRTSDTSALSEAIRLANEGSANLKKVLDDLAKIEAGANERQLDQASALAQQAFTLVEDAFATLERRMKERPSMVPTEMPGERETLRKELETIRRQFERARKARSIPALQAVTQQSTDVKARLDMLIASFGPLTLRERGVHEALEEGARLFLAGEYEKALAALDPAALRNVPLQLQPHVQLHVHLFRAAALYALYVGSGETNQAQRAQALAEIQQCKRLDSAFQPSQRAFAPRFRSFFQNENVPTQPAPAAKQ